MNPSKLVARLLDSESAVQRAPVTLAEFSRLPLQDISHGVARAFAPEDRILKDNVKLMQSKFGKPDCLIQGEFTHGVYGFSVNGVRIFVLTAHGKGTGYEALDAAPETIGAGVKIARAVAGT